MKKGWLSALGLALGAYAAQAAAPPVSPQFQELLKKPSYRQAVLNAAKQSPAWVRRGCKDASFTITGTISVWQQPKFSAAGEAQAGEWGQRIAAAGCGQTKLLNVVTTVGKPGALYSGALLPGDTRADPLLQHDATGYAFAAALAGVHDCKEAYIDDTKFIRQDKPTPPRIVGDLIENWLVVVCGIPVTVQLQFRLTPHQGTGISARVVS